MEYSIYVIYFKGKLLNSVIEGMEFSDNVFIDINTADEYVKGLPSDMNRDGIIIIPYVIPSNLDYQIDDNKKIFDVNVDSIEELHNSDFAYTSEDERSVIVFDVEDMVKCCDVEDVNIMVEIKNKILEYRGSVGKNPKPIYSIMEITSNLVLM